MQGANDPRVTKREADQMAVALRDRGVKVGYLMAENEGHGFLNPDNRLALYRSMEVFFGECLGGRVQASVSPAIETRIAEMTVDVDTLRLAEEEKVAYTEIRVGDPAIDGSAIATGEGTMRLVLVQGGREQEVGTETQTVHATEVNGQPALRIVEVLQSPVLGVSTDTLVVLQKTLAPLHHRSQNARRALVLDFDGARVTGSLTPAGGAAQPVQATLDGAVFDANALELVLRALPLREGYAVNIPAYLHEAGGKVWVKARVTGSEHVDAGGGAHAEAWVVEAEIAGQKITYWIAKERRELLKQVLVPAPGIELRLVR